MMQASKVTSVTPLSQSIKTLSLKISELLGSLSGKAIFNLRGSSIGALLSHEKKNFIWIDKSEESARNVFQDILFYRNLFGIKTNNAGIPELYFIPEGDLPSDEGARSAFMLAISDKLTDIVNPVTIGIITSERVIDIELWDPELLKGYSLFLKKSLEIERLALSERLVKLGYKKTPLVLERGDFCVKNFVIEVFPSTEKYPLRIEFFGDEIEAIKILDIETQKSSKEIYEQAILPARPPERGEGIKFKEWLKLLMSQHQQVSFSSHRDFSIFISEDISQKEELPESSIILGRRAFIISEGNNNTLKDSLPIDSGFRSPAGLGILYNERRTIDELPETLKFILKNNSVLIVTKTHSQSKRLRQLFFDNNMIVPELSIDEIKSFNGHIGIVSGCPSQGDLSLNEGKNLSSGLYIDGFILITDREVFGPGPFSRQLPADTHLPAYRISKILKEIEDLEEGDFVVHKFHGIGIYRGVQKLRIENIEEDVITIEYKDGAKLYLPLRNISLLHKFRAQEGIIPQIDTLGGKTWRRTRQKVEKKIKELARKLLRLYAERELTEGYAFSPEAELHREFASFFEFEETPDQLKAIEETISDMELPRPMERLIVGDVGYGKTEVAMRAAFKAVFDGKQVAVLVPTTILAEQHLKTFRQRFSAFPVMIESLSRLKSREEQKKIIGALQRGEIDIIIGTHSLLSKKIRFFDLGLLIIDEEHRFGVRDKEKLKELKKGVDVLLLSATPIPRTLQMAMSGLRNMSIIETSPPNRHSVKTFIYTFNPEVIKTAIENELKRNGQVLFIHNRIKDIEKMAEFIERIIPDIKIAVAHGEMNKRLTEDVMLRFLNKEIDVLVCTNIIGSGIDIPSANTIIINRSHEFGLSDLYQLRGRVGRSNIKAYAYLLIPGDEVITESAKKRLEAISEMSYLGAGIRLAMTDLEIRGAGNLLGKEQSGHINTVGFEFYLELLEKTIRELKGEKIAETIEPAIQISLPAEIPESYVEDIHIRLNLYRRLSLIQTEEELLETQKEIEERFGPLPAKFKNLLRVVELRLLAKALGIEKITFKKENQGKTSVAKVTCVEIQFIEDLKRNFLEDILNSLNKFKGLALHSVGSRRLLLMHARGGDNRDLINAIPEFLKGICSKITANQEKDMCLPRESPDMVAK